jgi:hypothetical protein
MGHPRPNEEGLPEGPPIWLDPGALAGLVDMYLSVSPFIPLLCLARGMSFDQI